MKVILKAYKYSPVLFNAVAAVVLVIVNQLLEQANLPSVDMVWLMGILGLGVVPVNFASVTPSDKVKGL